MKNRLWVSMFLLLLLGVMYYLPVQAASGMITFSTETPQVKKGEQITVVCQVTSEEEFTDTDFYIIYDSKILTFEKGGSKVSGGHGLVHVSSVGNTDKVTKRTFSLQFKAKRTGVTSIEISEQAKLFGSEGTTLSVSSNQLSVQVTEEGGEPSAATEEPAKPLSNNNKLASFEAEAVSIAPEFNSDVTEYQITIENSQNKLMYHFQAASKKARVRVEGNEDLKPGDNEVVVRVISESGKTRKYKFTVKRETEAETADRLAKENAAAGNSGVAFHVNQLNGVITLQNETSFTVLPEGTEGLPAMPEGYEATKIQVDGIQIPSYALENDLENDFILLYLQGPGGEKGIYRYDRKEKTIQRYVAEVPAKTVRVAEQKSAAEGSGNVLYIVIIGVLILLLLGALIAMLRMVSEGRKKDIL